MIVICSCGDVYLEGTCRTYEPAKRDYIERRLGESLQALDMMYKTKSTLDYKRGHGATTNDPDAIDYATSIVEKYLGKDAVVHPEHPSMAAEDFSASKREEQLRAELRSCSPMKGEIIGDR